MVTVALCVWVFGLTGMAAPGSAAEPLGLAESFVGPDYGPGMPVAPTRFAGQDKLWFHDDAWWALMIEPSGAGMQVFELLPDHTWRPTGTRVGLDPRGGADVRSVGSTLYVVSRQASAVQFVRLDYNSSRREYRARTVPPVVVTGLGTAAPPSISRDSTGRLWVTFATNLEVVAISSGDDGATWSAPQSISARTGSLAPGEASAVVAFDRHIGVMWSDRPAGVYRFAVHRDGAPDGEWRVETALAGPDLVDNKISLEVLHREPADAVVAAVSTSMGMHGEPPSSPGILVLSRAPDGTWSSTVGGTVGDALNAPLLQLDATNESAYLFADFAGSVFVKEAPLDTLAFAPGRGRKFLTGDGRPTDATGSADPVDARTGLVILASGALDHRYHHAETRIPGVPPPDPQPDVVAPDRPTGIVAHPGAGIVRLSWSASGDGNRWAPTAEKPPVRGYQVLRNGVEIGTTGGTSFSDTPPQADTYYEYAVRSVDFAGNTSGPATASVSVDEQRVPPVVLAGWSLLGVGIAGAVGFVAWRWMRRRLRRP